MDHWKGIKNRLRYKQGTKGLMLIYEWSNSLKIVGYSNLDFARCLDTKISTSGNIFTLTGGAISWNSSKHIVIACYDARGQTLWLKKLLCDLRVVDNIEIPLKIYCDNEPAILYAHNNMKTKAVRHINIKFYVVKEKIQYRAISLEHISTKKMLVRSITKGLPPNVFRNT
jgi:hypothetical protein